MVISKSEFMMFLKHPAWLWLKKFDKDKLPIPDEELQARFDEGALFESYAEKLFPKAVKLGYKKEGGVFSGTMYYALPDTTKKEIEKGTKIILQGRLEASNLTSIFDVLENKGKGVFDLAEIKSSTTVKPEHIYDLAFQTIVLEKAGLKVGKVAVIHVNNKYERKGEIEPTKLATRTDVTDDVREIIPEVEGKIEEAFEVLKSKTMPDISPRHFKGAGMDEWMEIFHGIKGKPHEDSIYKLCRLQPKDVAWLEDNGIESLKDAPLDAPLNDFQLRQIEAVRSGEQKVDKEEIKGFLGSLEYPLYFFDYETMAGVIPAFDGYRPYQQAPFQYSLHILEKPGGELKHKEYLHTEKSDPIPSLLKQMQEDFGPKGNVISWYMAFEKSRNAEMAKAYPKYEKFLLNLNDRMVDLMTPFAKGFFVDKKFFGSASIKAVLPALLPEFSYKELDISGGGQAQRVWMETVLEGKEPEKKEKVMADLRKYCSLDTYAMYAIYKYLLDKIT